MSAETDTKIEIRDLTMAYGSFVVMRDISVQIKRGEIFIIMGGSGCGKSTLLRHMVGLKEPAKGDVFYDGVPFWKSDEEVRTGKLRSFGVLFQSGALWSSMTLAENIGLVLGEYTEFPPAEIRAIARLKLALVGLKGFEDYYPAEISGGMCKRAGLARALALDPDVLFFDEPSAGLDPISSRNLDELIGLFIVTGVALGVIGLLLFSSGKLFSRTHDRILYFDETLNGLNVGAPVKYRGVTIGSIKRIMLRFNQATNDNAMPVIIEIDQKLLRERQREDEEDLFTEHALERRIQRGMRATLRSESLVTGVLYISLRPNPNAAPPIFHQLKKIYVEIPTEPAELGSIESVDFKSIEKNLNNLMVNVNTAVTNLHTADINAGVTNLLLSANRLITSPEITNDLAAVQATLDQYRLLGEKLNTRIYPLADGVTNTLAEADRALAQVRGAAQNLKILLGPDAPLPNDLHQTLHQLSGAVQSLSVLLDFLKEHPNALIAGREQPPKKP